MKALPAILLLAGLGQAAPAFAQAAASPLLGRWSVDISRLPMPPEARPRSVTITYSEAGLGKWRTNVDIIAADGSTSHAVAIADLDGTPAPVTGSPEADTTATTAPVPNVLVMALGRNGVPASTRVYAVAADGKSLVETAVYFSQDGMPIMRTNYFLRVQ